MIMARTAVFDPIVVEPKLTPEKVRELVERRMESAKLDYKQDYLGGPVSKQVLRIVVSYIDYINRTVWSRA